MFLEKCYRWSALTFFFFAPHFKNFFHPGCVFTSRPAFPGHAPKRTIYIIYIYIFLFYILETTVHKFYVILLNEATVPINLEAENTSASHTLLTSRLAEEVSGQLGQFFFLEMFLRCSASPHLKFHI